MDAVNVNCKQCKEYDTQAGCCDAEPSSLTEQTCLLRHIAYTLNLIYNEIITEGEDGEEWKFK